MPYDALIAPLWIASPRNPEEFDDWPMDRVYRMLKYIELRKQLTAELGGAGS